MTALILFVSTVSYGKDYQVIAFGAVWCGPCAQMEKDVWPDHLVKQYVKRYKIDVKHVDIDDRASKKLVDRFKVKAVPRVIFLIDDVPTKDASGYQDVPDLLKIFDEGRKQK